MMSVSFFVPGDPVPQGRARSFKLGNGIGHYDDPKSKAWKKVVAQVAGLQKNRWCGDGPLSVTILFYMPMAKSAKSIFHLKRPDIDNLSKAILDALNEICYKDDSQIVELTVKKTYAKGLNNTGAQVVIMEYKA
jgi:Holliday junction resolvase RusA-like endonuclease